jgi:hypothetical protein
VGYLLRVALAPAIKATHLQRDHNDRPIVHPFTM